MRLPQTQEALMVDKKFQDVIQHKSEEVNSLLHQKEYMDNYILEILNNFSFRYMDEANQSEKINQNTLRVLSLEKGIKEAFKIKNENLRAGLGELARNVSKAEGPTVAREIRVVLQKYGNSGDVDVSARISWGHPKHEFTLGTFVEKKTKYHFEDELHLRNTLARYLEEVCELFE
jgi:hypothetical protein